MSDQEGGDRIWLAACTSMGVAVDVTLNKYSSVLPGLAVVAIWALPAIFFIIWFMRVEHTKNWVKARFLEYPVSYVLMFLILIPFGWQATATMIAKLRSSVPATNTVQATTDASAKKEVTAPPAAAAPAPSGPMIKDYPPPVVSLKKAHKPVDQPPKVLPPIETATSVPQNPQPAQPPQTYGQQCVGSACAQGPGATATYNQFGARDWETMLDGEKQKKLIRDLQQIKGRYRLEWSLSDVGGMKMAGFLNYAFGQAKWTPNQIENYAQSICYPTEEFDCSGLRVTVKNKNSDIAKAAIDALSTFVPAEVSVKESDTVPEDQVNMLITKAK
jgi:hypothetical protein